MANRPQKISKEFWDTLSPEQQKSIAESKNEPHPGHFLPFGLNPNGIKAWDNMSHRQHQAANQLCSIETSYRQRFCEHFNSPKMDPNWIEKNGYLRGLTEEGQKVWEMIEPEAHLEVFQFITDGTAARVQQFINNAWTQFKNGALTEVQIVHGIITLACEEEEIRQIQKGQKK